MARRRRVRRGRIRYVTGQTVRAGVAGAGLVHAATAPRRAGRVAGQALATGALISMSNARGKRRATIASRKSGQRLSPAQLQQRRDAARRPRKRGRGRRRR